MIDPRVIVSLDGKTALLTRATWSEIMPVEKLMDRLSLHRKLAYRAGGRFAQHHLPWVAVIEQAVRVAQDRRATMAGGGADA